MWNNHHPCRRRGFSLLELLAVALILGLLATAAISHYGQSVADARKNACYVIKGEIGVQVERWRRRKGAYPAANLSDIGADPEYFPDGLPVDPVDGSPYTIDPATGEVVGHAH